MLMSSDGNYYRDLQGNQIHQSAIIGPDVKLGINNVIGPFCILVGDLTIGDENFFHSYVSVGAEPEDRAVFVEQEDHKGVIIGSRNYFREFVTINAGVSFNTLIGDENYFLRGSHVGHDVVVGDHVGIHCNAILGGYCIVSDYCYVGLAAVLNPRSQMMPGSLLGSNSLALDGQLLKRLTKYAGSPAKEIGSNVQALLKRGVIM